MCVAKVLKIAVYRINSTYSSVMSNTHEQYRYRYIQFHYNNIYNVPAKKTINSCIHIYILRIDHKKQMQTSVQAGAC